MKQFFFLEFKSKSFIFSIKIDNFDVFERTDLQKLDVNGRGLFKFLPRLTFAMFRNSFFSQISSQSIKIFIIWTRILVRLSSPPLDGFWGVFSVHLLSNRIWKVFKMRIGYGMDYSETEDIESIQFNESGDSFGSRKNKIITEDYVKSRKIHKIDELKHFSA